MKFEIGKIYQGGSGYGTQSIEIVSRTACYISDGFNRIKIRKNESGEYIEFKRYPFIINIYAESDTTKQIKE